MFDKVAYMKEYNKRYRIEHIDRIKADHKRWNTIHNPTRLKFKGKYIFLNKNPRKGICSKCHKKIGDAYIGVRGKTMKIKQTQMHHFAKYHKDDPLKDTVELCASCHKKEFWKHGK